jgi:Ca-activated chloride channel family protein
MRIRRGVAVIVGLLAVVTTSAGEGEVARLNEEGNLLYREGRYEEALARYAEALSEAPDSPILHYNLGNALFRLGRLEDAVREYGTATAGSGEVASLGTAPPFNEGTAWLGAKEYAKAVQRLRDVLLAAPDDEDARRNLELALARLQEQQRRKQGDSQQREGEQGDESDQQSRGDGEAGDQRTSPADGDGGPDDRQPDAPDAPPQAPEPQDSGEESQESDARSQDREEIGREEARRLLEALSQDEKADLKELLKRQPRKERKATRDW